MLNEVIEHIGFAPLKTQTKEEVKNIIDATLGLGGYTLEFVKRGARVLSFETDPSMLKLAQSRLKEACPSSFLKQNGGSFTLVNDNFVNIKNVAISQGFDKPDAIVFDLGIASPQLLSDTRGLSFQNLNAILDMRLNPDKQGVAAYDLVNALDENGLTELFEAGMEHYEAKRLARRIVEKRKIAKIQTVGNFIQATRGAVRSKKGINPATRPFMALRMAVNSELPNLTIALTDSLSLLKPGGKLIVVSFHSGEDAIVKRFFVTSEISGLGRSVSKKPILPTDKEVEENPRSRSAKLRVFVKK